MHRDDTSTPFVLYNCKICYINDEKGGWLTKFIARSAFVLFTFRENCVSSCNNSKKVRFEWNYSTDAMYVCKGTTYFYFLLASTAALPFLIFTFLLQPKEIHEFHQQQSNFWAKRFKYHLKIPLHKS